jgi:hypothetical protein
VARKITCSKADVIHGVLGERGLGGRDRERVLFLKQREQRYGGSINR